MSFNFAYLSGGRLYLKLGQTTVQSIASEFGQAAQQRGFEQQRRNGWKQKSMMSMGGSGDPKQSDPGVVAVAVQGICSTGADRLLYSLEAGEVGGIFSLERSPIALKGSGATMLESHPKTKEKRLFHSADFKIDRVDFNPSYQLIACAALKKDGTANIATMPASAVQLVEVTEGDSLDLAPKWIPGTRKAIVFQSAGISRNSNGQVIEHKHSTIEQLDFDRQEVITLASDPKYDLLSPQLASNGTLYYIRRPYRPLRQRVAFLQILKDTILMPSRLMMAVFEWLNYFTRRYTGKALSAAPQAQRASSNQLLFLGRLVDVGAEIQRNCKFGDADSPALVPRSWELIRQYPHQEPEVIGRGVLAFDVGQDGQIIYSNGSAVYGINPGGVAERLVVDRPIDQVVIIDGDHHLN